MNVRTTTSLLVAVCLAVALLFVLEDHLERDPHGSNGENPLVELGDVAEFSIRESTNSLSFIKRGRTWFVRHPIKSRADSGKIEQMLEQFEALKRDEAITAEQRSHRGLALEDYGLLEPRMRVLVRHSLGLTELMVGNDSPLGDRLYVQIKGIDAVFATSPALLELSPRDVNAYRDRFVLRGSPTQTSRIELHRAGGSFVRAVREDDTWRLQAPVKDWADARRIEQLLGALYALQVQYFVWDPILSEPGIGKTLVPELEVSETPRVETYGLASDEARARVQVWREGDLVESEIIFGKSTGPDSAEVYAKRREIESVYAVDARILDLLSVDVDALRSRDIFRLSPSAVKQFSVFRGEHKLIVSRAEAGEWQISEPGKWPADRQVVEDTILALSKWRAAAFIEATDASNMVAQLEPPHCVIHLSASAAGPDDRSGGDSTDESEAPVPGKVSIGRWKDGDTHVPLRLDGDTTLRLVPLELIRSVATSPTDALVYRKRRMLSIPPAGVKRIALESGSLSQAVIQDETGTWVAENATNAVSEETIRDILFFAADMRADRIEALATNDLSAYGLDDARATLTLGLSGQAGIQKTVMLGAPAGEKGVYSMVQGQDLVFVLPVLLGDRLFSGLLNEE